MSNDSFNQETVTCCICLQSEFRPSSFDSWSCSRSHAAHICETCKNTLVHNHSNCPICRAPLLNSVIYNNNTEINEQIINLENNINNIDQYMIYRNEFNISTINEINDEENNDGVDFSDVFNYYFNG
tara:strand:- start:15 stop:395 length:381 start_codon:yes stop_codon:yes gene_type:complete